MTVGMNIRKYRKLKNITQKQLGEAVGFKSSTAGVRIQQYEAGQMVPREDKLSDIAKALDIDVFALKDHNIVSDSDIIYIFFELEERLGMKIETQDDKIALILDGNNSTITNLINYINFWICQKEILFTEPETTTEKQKKDYELWKARFHKNIAEYYKRNADDATRYEGVKAWKTSFNDEPGYLVKQYQNGKVVVEQFVFEASYDAFCKKISVIPTLVNKKEDL